MNNMKKFASILLALVMVLAMAVPAMAATVNNNTNHEYKAYQIFTGTQATAGGSLGDVEWGDGINSSAFLTALKEDTRFVKDDANIFKDCTTAAEVAEVLAANNDVATAFAEVAAANKTGEGTTVPANGQNIELNIGYYVVIDQTTVSGENDAQNPALLQVVEDGDFEINKKYDVPEVDKTIKDEGEATDAEIGDTVTFVLTATMPSDLTGYETYKVVFHDTMSKGLTYGNISSVVVNNTSLTTDQYNAETAKANDGTTTLTVTIEDVLTLGATASSTIVVTYTATVNSDAVIGSAGNSNKVYLEYSNDPDSDGTGKTPDDEVIVFTYELDTVKVDGADADKKLSGAEFVLLNSGKTKVATVVNGKLTGWVAIPAAVDGEIAWPENTTLTSDADGKFIVAGLDAGTYYLRETKAPAGYNLLTADIAIEIIATITDTEDVQTLDALNIKVDGTEADGDVATGIVNATVENNIGSTLPETGGAGTVAIYTVGGLLVAAAVVMMISKKRAASK